MDAVRCKTCDTGVLMLVRKYRMSGIVVAIGYILLIPSVLGVLSCAFALFTMPKMKAPGAESWAEGMMVMLGFFWFVGGLLGWLLVMKKSVLQCNNCTAVVAAS
jgi:hypothetical protein